MIEPAHRRLSLRRQCQLLSVPRSTWYYEPAGESQLNRRLMAQIDQAYTDHPFYGVRKMVAHLGALGHQVNPKRVRRLMRLMGLEAIYPKKRLSVPQEGQRRYAYLLRDRVIDRPDQVWCADITYLRLRKGFGYLVAVMDWHSRYVLSWSLSSSLEGSFCVEALEAALRWGTPGIFNTDQGVQFTSEAFTSLLERCGVQISMDGRGRCFDNIFVERLWRSVKHEEVYLKDYEDLPEARHSLKGYWRFYNEQRPHQGLSYRTPAQVYFAGGPAGPGTSSAVSRTVAGPPVALRAPSGPATVEV